MDNKQLFQEVSGRIDELVEIMCGELIPSEITRLRECGCRGHCKNAAARWEKVAHGLLSTSELLDGIEVNQAWLEAAPPPEEEAYSGV